MKIFEWTELIERLKHHRERLKISQLTDYEIYSIGVSMSTCEDKKDLLS